MARNPAPKGATVRKAATPKVKSPARAASAKPVEVTEKPAVAKSRAKPAAKAAPTKIAPPKPAAKKPAPAKAAKAEAPPPVPPAPEPQGAPEARGEAPPPQDGAAALFLLPPEQRQALETLSLNLAKAAVTAQAAIAQASLQKGQAGAEINTDPFHVAPSLTEVAGRLAAEPERLMRAQAELFDGYMNLWRAAARRMVGEEAEPVATPAKGDKRFNDPDWSANPVFDVMKQSYLLTANWLNTLVGGVQGVDPITKRRVEFFTKMLTDAFSPSNFLISNPVALREAMQSQGQSLLKGAENFAADMARGGGALAISQTDLDKFKVGENVATAPGKVVFENALFQLLQFAPSTDQVHEIPLLIFPPWINKFYILDLQPGNSLIRWLSSQGFTVFVCS